MKKQILLSVFLVTVTSFAHSDWLQATSPLLEQSQSAVKNLSNTVKTYCSQPQEAILLQAQNQWRQLAQVWIPYQALQPSRLEQTGLSFRMHFWPDPKDLIGKQTQQSIGKTPFKKLPAPAVGLDAMEWLLFPGTGIEEKATCKWAVKLIKQFAGQIEQIKKQPLSAQENSADYQVNTLVNMLAAMNKRLDRLTRSGKGYNGYGMDGWRSQSQVAILNGFAQVAALRATQMQSHLSSQSLGNTQNLIEALEEQLVSLAIPPLGQTPTTPQLEKIIHVKEAVENVLKQLANDVAQEHQVTIGFNNADGD